jgi:predicted small lipoprotein YifL
MKRIILFILVLLFVSLACGQSGPVTPFPAQENSASDSGETIYGFFPSPPKVSLLSVVNHFKDLSQYGDFVLFQHNIPWADFAEGVEGESQSRTDMANQETLARQNGLDTVYVVDALNGLNRREFKGLPAGWEASFANPQVRAAFTNYTLWVVRTFHPHYLGLASEINTYMDAHPEDASNFISLYHEVYALVKAEAPNTQIFVTFQWDDLNNMFPQPEEGNRTRLSPNWEQVEVFEPNLDLWAISSYPYFVFPSGADIPADYYSRLLDRTDKPVAVAEGGWATRGVGEIHATPEDQAAYLNAIHDQLGSRMAFWVYLLLNDLDMDSYGKASGISNTDITTLSLFASLGLREMDGTPKPALEVWMEFRRQERQGNFFDS